jgi:hypothetical protein
VLLIGEGPTRNCAGLSRRAFVQAGFLGAMGAALPQQAALAAAAGHSRAVILLWLWGGPPHLDTFDPKPDAPSEYRGPYRPIATPVPGIQVSELLPKLAQRAAQYALIRSLRHGTNDHGLAGTIAMTGHMPQGGRIEPHAGSIASRIKGSHPVLSSFVTLGERMQQGHRLIGGEGGGNLGAVYDPLRVTYDPVHGAQLGELTPPKDVGPGRVDRRRELVMRLLEGDGGSTRDMDALRRYYQQAFSLMTSGEGRRVFDLALESPRTRDSYGRHRFGQSCLLARRLVQHGVPFVQVNWSQHVESEEDAGDGGWDNHYRNFEMLAERQCWPFDQACSALLDDLRDRGMLADTLVVAVGEFGRTPKINQQTAGRDHWEHCYSALAAGGGVRGGQVVGASDDRGEHPAARPLSPADLNATILESLGITRTDVLALGLPAAGEPIHELFG